MCWLIGLAMVGGAKHDQARQERAQGQSPEQRDPSKAGGGPKKLIDSLNSKTSIHESKQKTYSYRQSR